MILPIVAVLVLAACIIIPFVAIRRARGPEPRELPPLVFSGTHDRRSEPRIASPSDFRPVERAPDLAQAEPPSFERVAAQPVSVEPGPRVPITVEPGDTAPTSTETVHFRRPSDQAVQLLPGRLEVLSGLTMPRE